MKSIIRPCQMGRHLRGLLALFSLAALLAACSSGSGGRSSGGASGLGGGRPTSDPRVRSFMGRSLPVGGGGEWLRSLSALPSGATPKVIYYQFAFPS